MKILAHLFEMAESEMLSHIPASVYRRIKEKDENPTWRAYVIGHEGVSEGRFLGVGHVLKTWYESAIRKLTEKLALGTKIFHGHDTTQDHSGRTPIGEVVGKTVERLQELASAIAITYIYPHYRELPLDVASVEADVTMPRDLNNVEIHDDDVQAVKAIALGSSKIDRPGFPRATLLAQVQEFAKGDSQNALNTGDKMTREEIKKAIAEGSLKPSDLFEADELSSDPSVRALAREKREAEEGFQKRMADKLKEEKKNWEKEKEDLLKENTTLKKAGLKTKVQPKFDKMAKDRSLSERQKAFIDDEIDTFAPEKEETIDTDLNVWVDGQLETYERKMKVLGIKDGKSDDSGDGMPSGNQDIGEGKGYLESIPDSNI